MLKPMWIIFGVCVLVIIIIIVIISNHKGKTDKDGTWSNNPKTYTITSNGMTASYTGVDPPFILLPGERISNPSNTAYLEMQTNGKLCVHNPNKPDVCTSTSGKNFMLFDTDGSLGVYNGTPDSKGSQVWPDVHRTLPNYALTVFDVGPSDLVILFKGTANNLDINSQNNFVPILNV